MCKVFLGRDTSLPRIGWVYIRGFSSSDGKTYRCPTMSITGKVYCGGTEYVDTKATCPRCNGNGQLTYPLSPHARITSQVNYVGIN